MPVQSIQRPGWEKPLPTRLVPSPTTRLEFLAHPRLRRTSPITHYAAAATIEATAGLRANPGANRRLGLIVCLQSGCVQYSQRFFEETLKDPATASPVLFPETVMAAPASHIAVLLKDTILVDTLVGDPSAFLQGLSLALQWLLDDLVDACVIVGAEESSWLLADALWHLERSSVISSGAGALCLCRDPAMSLGVELEAISQAHIYSARLTRTQAARAMRAQFGAGSSQELLCDGLGDSPRAHRAELAAWSDWRGLRLSPKRILGEGLMAATGWQCVCACDAVAAGTVMAANVSLVGNTQQAIGARFVAMRK